VIKVGGLRVDVFFFVTNRGIRFDNGGFLVEGEVIKVVFNINIEREVIRVDVFFFGGIRVYRVHSR